MTDFQSAPGVAPPKKSIVPSIVLGVLGFMFFGGSCLLFGGAAYLYSESDRHRSLAASSYGSYDPYGGGGDDIMAGYYRSSAVEEEQMSMGSGCCGMTCCLSSLGLLVVAAVMGRRARS